jgi:hypothetical protein
VFLPTTFQSVTTSVQGVLVSKMFGPRLGLPVQWIALSDSRWTLLTTTGVLGEKHTYSPYSPLWYSSCRSSRTSPGTLRRLDNTNKMRRVLPIRIRCNAATTELTAVLVEPNIYALDSLNLNEPRHKVTPFTPAWR